MALANEPSILLADEPTGELDTATALTIYAAFRKFNQEAGLTIVIVSHDPTIAQHVDRVVSIRDGQLASETVRTVTKDGTTEEIFEELTVLDSAGRLQIPRDYREALGISRRVQLEMTHDGVLIRPSQRESAEPEPLWQEMTAGEDSGGDGKRPFLQRLKRWWAR